MDTWIWVVVALLLGALVGALGVFLVARRRWADAARADELQRELDGYRQEVGDHFVQTAELVNDLTRSYKAVYDHLEQGAYRLVDEETLRKQLGDVDAETVRLEYIGRRNKAAVLASGTRTVEAENSMSSVAPAKTDAEPARVEAEQEGAETEPESVEAAKKTARADSAADRHPGQADAGWPDVPAAWTATPTDPPLSGGWAEEERSTTREEPGSTNAETRPDATSGEGVSPVSDESRPDATPGEGRRTAFDESPSGRPDSSETEETEKAARADGHQG